jgi:hypothetical protein
VLPKLDLVYSTLGTPGQYIPLLPPSPSDPSLRPTLIEIATSAGSRLAAQNWGLHLPFYGRWVLDLAKWWLTPRVPEGVRWWAHNTSLVPGELQALADVAGRGGCTPLVGKGTWACRPAQWESD